MREGGIVLKSVLFFVGVLIVIQFIPLKKTNPPVDASLALQTDEKVQKILKKSCYDCHSNETNWSLYANIAPFSFGVVSHVEDGRAAFNFSKYKNIDKETKIARLKRAIKTVKLGMMPLSSYLMFHKDAELTKEEKEILIDWFVKELKKLGVKRV